jgi:hypothetical protein
MTVKASVASRPPKAQQHRRQQLHEEAPITSAKTRLFLADSAAAAATTSDGKLLHVLKPAKKPLTAPVAQLRQRAVFF